MTDKNELDAYGREGGLILDEMSIQVIILLEVHVFSEFISTWFDGTVYVHVGPASDSSYSVSVLLLTTA